jgi:MFS family permease
MIQRIRSTFGLYPGQFWLLFSGYLLTSTGSSMIWPFMMIYARQKLNLPMSTIASLMTVNAVSGLLMLMFAGPLVDRLGRKWIMAASLAANGLGYFYLGTAESFTGFAVAMAINGFFNPLYRVGADAMIADILPAESRMEGYALMRLSNNLGVAIGPAIGGFLVAAAYYLAFDTAAACLVAFGLVVALFIRETLPEVLPTRGEPLKKSSRGYWPVLKDGKFLSFLGAFTLTSTAVMIIWVLLGVYAKDNYGVPENLYGWLPTTNAVVIVVFQVFVTRLTRKYKDLRVMALGAFFYASAAAGISLGRGFWGFWLCMVVVTVGEMVLIPTSSTYTANRAPVDMRGRYMALYTWAAGIALGVGPVLGGFLNDNFGPRAIWYGAGIIGFAGVAWFLLEAYREKAAAGPEDVGPTRDA